MHLLFDSGVGQVRIIMLLQYLSKLFSLIGFYFGLECNYLYEIFCNGTQRCALNGFRETFSVPGINVCFHFHYFGASNTPRFDVCNLCMRMRFSAWLTHDGHYITPETKLNKNPFTRTFAFI